MARLLWNSAVVAVVSAVGKIAISMLSAFAIVYFRLPGQASSFWMIFITLMLPMPVRILPTYEVIGNLGWLDSLRRAHGPADGLRDRDVPVPAVLPDGPQRAGRGGPDRRRRAPCGSSGRSCLPLSWANIAALFVVLFIYGWNEYFWPLLITNTEAMRTVVIGLERSSRARAPSCPTWNLIMAAAMMALLPPVAVIVFMQRWFVKGLIETEK